jgi:hypothetical protein
MPKSPDDGAKGRRGLFQKRRLELVLDHLRVEWIATVSHMARRDLFA